MTKQDDGRNEIQELSATDANAVGGGAIMEILVQAWLRAQRANCLIRLTREGTVIDCNYPYRP